MTKSTKPTISAKFITDLLAAFAGILLIASTSMVALGEKPSKPNIVLIISDDQGWNDYGFMGHPEVETPNLDALARRSSVFKSGYVPTALCRPSLATLMTGHYAATHHVTGNDPSPKYGGKGTENYTERCHKLISKTAAFDLLPEVLGRQGYLSHQSGKLWEGSYQRCGFTHGMTRGFPEEGGRHGDDGLRIGRDGLDPISDFLDIAQSEDKPFFLWYAPYLPHSPHTPPKRLEDKYAAKVDSAEIAKYYAMCEWFDETCGELIDNIDERGMSENTMFIYVCDNGWIQSESGSFAPKSKLTSYEGGVRTPIMYHWPGKIEPQDRAELATSLDIYPTILAAAGATISNDLPGLNLLPYLMDQKPIQRGEIFGEGFAHDIADLDDPSRSRIYQWVIQGDWKLLVRRDGEVNRYARYYSDSAPKYQLYDLSSDPTEQTNLAEKMPEKVRVLSALIDAWEPLKHPMVSKSETD